MRKKEKLGAFLLRARNLPSHYLKVSGKNNICRGAALWGEWFARGVYERVVAERSARGGAGVSGA